VPLVRAQVDSHAAKHPLVVPKKHGNMQGCDLLYFVVEKFKGFEEMCLKQLQSWNTDDEPFGW
jgi:hypothetical protein